MGRKTNIIITASIIILLFVVLIIARKNDVNIREISRVDLLSTLKENANSVVYFGDAKSKELNKLREYYKEYKIPVFTSNSKLEDVNKLIDGLELEKTSFVLFSEANPLTIVGDDETDHDLFYKYLYNVIPENEIEYKVLGSAEEYIKKVNSKKFTVAVFGKESCSYCKLYLNTINEEAKNKKINIYYFDADNYDQDEYLNIISELNFEIPPKCNTKDETIYMVDGFPKPLTIITKNGEMVDCLLGYVSEKTLNDKLIEVGVINEK